MRNKRRLVAILLLTAFGPGVLFLGCEKKPAPAPSGKTAAAPAAVKQVQVVRARMEPWPETIRIQGSLLAYDEAVVGSKLAGRVQTVAVDIGSIVKAGDPLVTLVRSELDLRVQLAEAQLKQACAAIGLTPNDDESQFKAETAPGVMMEEALVIEARGNVERAQKLISTRAIAEGEYETYVAALKAAQARYHSAINAVGEQVSLIGVRRKELALAQQAVMDSQVVAPFAGIVGARRVSPGEFVSVGQAVVTLVRADRLRFTAGVPESRAAAIKVGQRVDIELGAPGQKPLVAAISRISPTVIQSSRSIVIEVDVPNPDLALTAGLFAEANVVVQPESRTIVVPKSSVVQFAGVEKVWLVTDGKAKQQTVRTGREDATRVEILDGVPDDSIIVSRAEDGHDGPVVAVEAQPRERLQAQSPEGGATSGRTSGGAW